MIIKVTGYGGFNEAHGLINRVREVLIAEAGTDFASPVTLGRRDISEPSFSIERLTTDLADGKRLTYAKRYKFAFALSNKFHRQYGELADISDNADVLIIFDDGSMHTFTFLDVSMQVSYSLEEMKPQVTVSMTQTQWPDGSKQDDATVAFKYGDEGEAAFELKARKIQVSRELARDRVENINGKIFERIRGKRLKLDCEVVAPKGDVQKLQAFFEADHKWARAWDFNTDGGHIKVTNVGDELTPSFMSGNEQATQYFSIEVESEEWL